MQKNNLSFVWRALLCISSYSLHAQFVYNSSSQVKPRAPEKALDVLISFKEVVANMSFVFGMGMVLMGLYKYGEHRKNPMATSFGSVSAMMFVGCSLMLIQFIPLRV